MSNTLTLYFSHSGNSDAAAKWIAGEGDTDLFRVVPVEGYSRVYQECVGRAVAEWRANARPGVKAVPENVEHYDTLVVVYPLWCGTMPMCLYTVLEKLELSGKRIWAVCTHEGSGFARSVEELSKLCPGADVRKGIALKGSQVQESMETILEWAQKNL